jgi:hypothetical protein
MRRDDKAVKRGVEAMTRESEAMMRGGKVTRGWMTTGVVKTRVTTAQRGVTTAKRGLTTAQRGVVTAQRGVTTRDKR